MNGRYQVESSHAGRGWRLLQLLGFLALASGIALVVMMWGDAPEPGRANTAAITGTLMAIGGMLVYLFARGMARLLHG